LASLKAEYSDDYIRETMIDEMAKEAKEEELPKLASRVERLARKRTWSDADRRVAIDFLDNWGHHMGEARRGTG